LYKSLDINHDTNSSIISVVILGKTGLTNLSIPAQVIIIPLSKSVTIEACHFKNSNDSTAIITIEYVVKNSYRLGNNMIRVALQSITIIVSIYTIIF